MSAVRERLLGYWRESPPSCLGFPDPTQLVTPDWEPVRRDRIAAYLNAGVTRASYAGASSCRLADCRDPLRDHLGTRDLTDGYWIWPEGLAHYVTDHAVRLPDEFVADVAAHNYAIGTRFGDPTLEPDPSFWLRWSASNTPPPAPTSDACSLEDARAICTELSTRRWQAVIAPELGRWKLEIAIDGDTTEDYSGPIGERLLREYLFRSRRPDDDAVLSPARATDLATELSRPGLTTKPFAGTTAADGRPWWAIISSGSTPPTKRLDAIDLRAIKIPEAGWASFLPGGWKVEVVPAMDELAWRFFIERAQTSGH